MNFWIIVCISVFAGLLIYISYLLEKIDKYKKFNRGLQTSLKFCLNPAAGSDADAYAAAYLYARYVLKYRLRYQDYEKAFTRLSNAYADLMMYVPDNIKSTFRSGSTHDRVLNKADIQKIAVDSNCVFDVLFDEGIFKKDWRKQPVENDPVNVGDTVNWSKFKREKK